VPNAALIARIEADNLAPCLYGAAVKIFGVSRAFLWMFIRSSSKILQFRDHSFHDPDRMDNLLKAHS
jgi:hypothetical protein